MPDTPECREAILALVAAGNGVCGEGTHWIEEREIAGAYSPAEIADRWAAEVHRAHGADDGGHVGAGP
jgi:hypothetical protein